MAFDIITPEQLGQGSIATSPSLTTLYTVPDKTRAILKTIDVSNTTTVKKRVNLYLVPSGGSASTSNILISNTLVPANGLLQWTGTHVMNTGDTIQSSGSDSGLTVTVSGGEAV